MMKNKRISTFLSKYKGFFKIFGSGVLTKIISFFGNLILIRFISKDAYGVFSYVANIYSIIIIFSGFGILPTILQLASENYSDEVKDAIYHYGFIFGLFSNIILCFVIALVFFIHDFKIPGSNYLFLLYLLLPLLEYIFQYIVIYFRSERNENAYFIVNVSFQSLYIVISFAGILLFKEKGFIIGQYLSYLISFIIGVKINKRRINYGIKLTSKLKSDFSKISFASLVGNAFYQLKPLLTIYILGYFIPNSLILADYNVASKIPNALVFVPLSLVTYIYPYFAEHLNNIEWFKEHFKKVMIYNCIFNFAISSIIIIFAKPITLLAFGSDYVDSVSTFRLLMINYFIISSFVTIPGNILITQRKHVFNLVVNIVGSIISVFVSIFLIKTNASMGAALSEITVSMFFSIVYISYIFYYMYNLKKRCE